MFVNQRMVKWLLVGMVAISVAACSKAENTVERESEVKQGSASIALAVYKSPTCGCCGNWIEHLNQNGFKSTAHNLDDLSAMKAEKGIRPQYQSCHTAVSEDGYVFEGHVPARFIQQFLKENPEGALGLAVPGMPMGRPGMEMSDHFTPYEVVLLKADGTATTYALVESQQEQY